jgi:hypothetical protein
MGVKRVIRVERSQVRCPYCKGEGHQVMALGTMPLPKGEVHHAS